MLFGLCIVLYCIVLYCKAKTKPYSELVAQEPNDVRGPSGVQVGGPMS